MYYQNYILLITLSRFYIKSLAKLQLYFKVLHKNVVIKIATAVFIEIQLKIIKILNYNKLLKTIKLPLV